MEYFFTFKEKRNCPNLEVIHLIFTFKIELSFNVKERVNGYYQKRQQSNWPIYTSVMYPNGQ